MAPNKTGEPIINPNKFLDIPKWINETYFAPILEQNIPGYNCITKFTPIAATVPGENYTSIMVRVIIDVELKGGKSQQVSYVLKTCLAAENQGSDFIKSMSPFPREKKMYATYIPQFEQLYKDQGMNVKLGPKCLYFDETSKMTTFVMEDLKCEQYGNIDRLKGFDMAHMHVVLKKLAEFHAASAVYAEMNGPYESMFHSSFFNESNRAILEKVYEPRAKLYNSALMEWGLEDADKYIVKTPTFDEFFAENLLINSSDPNEFNVLNHGDCWSNNIMFRHDESGKMQDMLFVDFQLCKWGSPVQDLWYLITTSAELAIKVKHFDHFIEIYHKRLVECLLLLKYRKPLPSLKELHIMLLKYGFWGIFAARNIAPAILFPSDKDANMESFMKNGPEADAFRFKVYTNPIYVQAMLQFYPFLYNKGLFDIKTKLLTEKL